MMLVSVLLRVLFESAPIAEFFNDIGGGEMLAADPVERARQRAWIECTSTRRRLCRP